MDRKLVDTPKVAKFHIIKPIKTTIITGKMPCIGLFSYGTSDGLEKPAINPRKKYKKKYYHININ
tara:strand:+ start:348 stop:542 length:195 start_codon:yes stop_codon:yes gene_type:complete